MTRESETAPTPFRLAHLLTLYARTVEAPGPADRAATAWMRGRGYLGSHDRAWLGDAVFALLRARCGLRNGWALFMSGAPLPAAEEPAAALAYWLLRARAYEPADAAAAATEATRTARQAAARRAEAADWTAPAQLEEFLTRARPGEPPPGADTALVRAWKWSLPVETAARWTDAWGEAEAAALAEALASPAAVDLRVNTLRADRETCRARLAAEGIDSEPLALSPWALRLARRANVTRSAAFCDGWCEIQDAASQLAALALAPAPGETLLDACAGGGGKALALAALVGPQGTVLAYDRDAERLAPLRQRARRAGAGAIRLLRAAPTEPADGVLIDAPCSGLGTLRRNPEHAWRRSGAATLARLAARQRACLEAYAPLVRTGGALVYAVCSVEPAEGEDVIAAFLRGHPEFAPDDLAAALLRAHTPLAAAETNGHLLRLWPHRHHTDGFFIARLVRRN